MTKKILFSCVILFLLGNLTAQITITSNNMPVSGDTCRYSSARLSSIGNYTATGANYFWDFSTLDSTGQGIRKFVPSTATPYSLFFFGKYGEKTMDSLPIPAIPLGTYNLTFKNIYSFYKKNGTSSFNAVGQGQTISGIPLGITATSSNEDKLYQFPLQYLDRDSSTFFFTTPTLTVVPFNYKKHGYRITEVDGWGTITTPYGTDSCIRVVTTQYSTDTIRINALPAGFDRVGFPNYVRSYQWLTLNEKIPFYEVTGNLIAGAFVPTQARYRDRIRYWVGVKEEEKNLLAISLFPNPSNNELNIITQQYNQAISVQITDIQGKVLMQHVLHDNTQIVNKHTLDISDLARGMYILNLSIANQQQSIKFSKQ